MEHVITVPSTVNHAVMEALVINVDLVTSRTLTQQQGRLFACKSASLMGNMRML
jgi:hypothetical protein